ncbi:hypothetical protein [Sphingomonas aracearum]|uniref:Uncharacterized protein n=1 Tax=Sphingomonas aracearum TaxID=2283317 RepID=A0A369VR47_9SPHN|nr:hypothetical protein [Sphingomonas aracearum]RDE04856.1 hypothetical protein DVW87_14910 [Sphingomonas aracearum]
MRLRPARLAAILALAPAPLCAQATPPPIRLVAPAEGALASFALPQVPRARVDVLAVSTARHLSTALFRVSIGSKQLYERLEIDCGRRQWRWVGDGTSVAEALRYRDDMGFGPAHTSDIKHPYVQYVCNEGVIPL